MLKASIASVGHQNLSGQPLIMALSKKQLQQKREKKKNKRSVKKWPSFLSTPAYCNWPLYECYISGYLWKNGIGQVMVARKNEQDDTVVGIYLVDVFCLGIRDSKICFTDLNTYKKMLDDMNRVYEELKCVDPSYVYALINQAEAFAKQLGFEPHLNFSKAKKLLKNIPLDESLSFTFGKEGKPCYIQGPNDSLADVSRVIHTLETIVGRENDDFFIERL